MASYTSTLLAEAELSHDRATGQSEGARAAKIAIAPPEVPPRVALRSFNASDAGTSGNGPTLIRCVAVDPGHIEAHAQPEFTDSRAARRRRCALIAGLGSACVLVTGLAMKFAGCTNSEIQWPITILVMIMGMFLTPAYANSIA